MIRDNKQTGIHRSSHDRRIRIIGVVANRKRLVVRHPGDRLSVSKSRRIRKDRRRDVLKRNQRVLRIGWNGADVGSGERNRRRIGRRRVEVEEVRWVRLMLFQPATAAAADLLQLLLSFDLSLEPLTSLLLAQGLWRRQEDFSNRSSELYHNKMSKSHFTHITIRCIQSKRLARIYLGMRLTVEKHSKHLITVRVQQSIIDTFHHAFAKSCHIM